MEFNIDIAENLKISDAELSELLSQVYVDAGFVTPEIAKSVFEVSAVRKRGKLLCARSKNNYDFAGMLIIVYPESKEARFQQFDAAELHLLGVKNKFQGYGLGKSLVSKSLEDIYQAGYPRILLATQKEMHAAHHLYKSLGFYRKKSLDFKRNETIFIAYEKLTNS